MQAAIKNLGFSCISNLLGIFADSRTVRSDVNNFIFHAAPISAGFPFAIKNLLNSIYVIRTPVPNSSCKFSFRCCFGHVHIIADTVDASFLSGLLWARGVLVLSYNVGTEINQSQSSLFFTSWIVPGIGPNNFNFGIWIDRTNTKSESIDAAYNFRNWESCNITNYVALSLFAGNDTGQIAGFIHAAEISTYIGSCFVA